MNQKNKQVAQQAYLEPHSWPVRQIVSYYISTRQKRVKQGRMTMEEVQEEATEKFGPYDDLRDFALRHIGKCAVPEKG